MKQQLDSKAVWLFFVSFILLGFLIHIIDTIISHLLLGKKAGQAVENS